jgi:hypothetical protein
VNPNLSDKQFEPGSGRSVQRLDANDPELGEFEGQKATLIEGPRRWHGTLARHWQTNSLGLNIGQKTRRRIETGHQIEVGPDAKARFDHWKAHATDAPPGPDCFHCRRQQQGRL